jgi:hypothetical protein
MQGFFEKTPEHDKSHRFAMGKWPFWGSPCSNEVDIPVAIVPPEFAV